MGEAAGCHRDRWGRGIGRAVARRLAGDGFAVVVADSGVAVDGSGPDPLVARAAALEIGGRAVPADVTTADGVAAVVAAATELGSPSVLVLRLVSSGHSAAPASRLAALLRSLA